MNTLTLSDYDQRMTGTIAAANKLIAEACLVAYKQAQVSKSGKAYKTVHPYCVPAWCKRMLALIQTGNEHDIKAAMHAARIGCYELV